MRRGAELLTIGHGTAGADELGERLRAAGVASVVDIRIAPGSRRHPHVSREELARWLPALGNGYRWEPRLGGFRKPSPDSPDMALRNSSFRGYAGWMREPPFLEAMADLLEQVDREPTAVMCSETVWWRCHRRLVADFAVSHVPVRHLMPGGKATLHVLTEGVRRREDGLLVYDGKS